MRVQELMKVMVLGCFVVMQTACVFGGEEEEPESWNTEEPEPDPEVKAVLDVNYVSGHLGNYSDCPDKGYSEDDGASAGEAEDSAGFAPVAGDCAEGESCGGLWNCEEAQITVNLANTSMEAATGVSVEMIELLDSDGMVRAVLPVNDVMVVGEQMSFSGELDAGEMVQVRIDYKGPVNLSELLAEEDPSRSDGRSAYQSSAQLRITVGAENADDVSTDTKEVYVISDVAT